MINSLNDRNLLILTVYFICVAYIFYRAINSLQDKVRIQLDREDLNSQLENQKLKNLIGLEFPLAKQYKIDQVSELSVNIENKSQHHNIYVDWDSSSLTDLLGRSRRVIRITPNMTLESQVKSAIAAGIAIRERLTAEDALGRDAATGALKISSPLFNITRLKNGPPAQKKQYSDFMTLVKPLEFSVRLVLSRVELVSSSTDGGSGTHILSCKFRIHKVPWIEAATWKPRK